MSLFVLQTDKSALFWSQTTTLDGVQYLLTFRYNSRESCYYLQIQSADASILYAQGIKLVPAYPLLRGYSTPPGELVVEYFSATDDSPPALGALGDGVRCTLVYLDQATVLAGGADSWRNPGP